MPGSRTRRWSGPIRILNAKPKDGVVRAAIYGRVSTGNQKTIGQQIEIAKQRCRDRGWRVDFVLFDKGGKGEDFERTGFQKLFELAEEGLIDVVVVWKIDRIARSLAHASVLEESLRADGVAIHSCTEPIDTTTAEGRFIFGIMVSAAAQENEIRRERVKLGMSRAAAEGRWARPRVAFGYRRGRGMKLRQHAPEAELLRTVFRIYQDTQSLLETAAALNRLGMTKRGEPWNQWRVHEVLTNKIAMGIIDVSGQRWELDRLAIIDRQEFERTQALLASANRAGQPLTPAVKAAAIENVFTQYMESLQALPDDGSLLAHPRHAAALRRG